MKQYILIPVIMIILMVCGCLYICAKFTKEDEKTDICTDIYTNTYTDTNTGNGAAPITSTADYVSKFCVVIDAGHGGSDGGIVSGLLSQTTPMQIFLSAFIATIMKMMRR